MRYAIVDISNLFNRCRFVTQGDAYTKAGMALHIVFRSLRKIHRDYKIDHIAFAVDNGSWRYAIYPHYKARRKVERLKLTPSETEENQLFYDVLNLLVDYLSNHTRCTVLKTKNIEADDFVSAWIQHHPDDEHYIVSGDSDFVQLLAPNVKIFDGVQDILIDTDGILNKNGERLEFSIKPQSGKIKTGIINPMFVPEDEWWRKALFIKIIRGDAGDGIFSSYPGVRFKGSSKREGICEAWEDRNAKGFHWNNFFQQEWDKVDLVNLTTSRVRVVDEFRINTDLIDLTRQPSEIKDLMKTTIMEAIAKPAASNVGIHFLKFCGAHELPDLAKEVQAHTNYLNAGYK